MLLSYTGRCQHAFVMYCAGKANIGAASSDIHQLQFGKLHHFKLETYKSIRWFPGNQLIKSHFRINHYY